MDEHKAWIRHWHESATLDEAARRTGMDRRACSNRAAMYRRKGVPMPRRKSAHVQLQPGKKGLDWEGLARYAEALAAVAEKRERLMRYLVNNGRKAVG